MTYGHWITNQGWIFIASNMYDAIILNVCFITNSNVDASPLITVPNQIDEHEPISTSPITMELDATKQSWPIFGLLLLKDKTDMDILFTFINK